MHGPSVNSLQPLPEDAIKLMVDLSTAHITIRDNGLLYGLAHTDNAPLLRVIVHHYGFIVFTKGPDPQLTASLGEMGFSDAFIDLYDRAAGSIPPVLLLNFDCDGETVEGLPTFDW
jgi:hypothetical protein